MPAEVKALSDDINRALDGDDRVKAEQLMRALHDRAVVRIQRNRGRGDRRRQSAPAPRGASRHAARARRSRSAGRHSRQPRRALADLARRLPSHIRMLDREQSMPSRRWLDMPAAKKTSATVAAQAKPTLCFTAWFWSWAGWRRPGSSSASRHSRRRGRHCAYRRDAVCGRRHDRTRRNRMPGQRTAR